MTSALRTLVSKQKVRYVDDAFNLDLTYVTPRIIAMGFPCSGSESLWRNPMSSVRRFLDSKHPEHYKVYNLCVEPGRTYDGAQFGNRTASYPWRDHEPPALGMLSFLARNVGEWLAEDPLNVAAIHCKAGKGRTGVAVCCAMMWDGGMGANEVCWGG